MYIDPITKNTYPSKDWMMSNMANLPEVKAAYGSAPDTTSAPKTLNTPPTVVQPSTSGLTSEQVSGLQSIYQELQARQLAGTPSNQPRAVTEITESPTIPDKALETSYGKLSTITADSLSSLITKQEEKLQAEKASAQSTLSKAGLIGTGDTLQEQLITGYQSNAPRADYQGALQQYQSQYGVTQSLDEYKLQGEKVVQMKASIENLDLQRQAELDAALNRQGSMNSISADQQRINQKYDSQRAKLVGDYNVEAAILAAKSNNLSESNNLVQQAVQAYTADITAEMKRFDNLYSIASDWVSSLTSQEKSILDDVRDNLSVRREEEITRLNNVLNLKLQYHNSGIEASDSIEIATQKAETQKSRESVQGLMLEYNQYGAGVNINDSYEEALKKIQPYYNEANRTTQIVGSAETGYSLIDTKTGEVVKNIESISGGGSGNGNEKSMSVWEIQQYSKLYGWTPPSGFTRKQIDDFVNANPNATPAELERGAKQALLGMTNETGETIEINSDYFKSLYSQDELYKIAEKNNLVNYWSPFSSHDVDRLLKSIDSTIEQYRNQGYSDEEILENIYNNVINK